ncbi:MAG: prepilin-type N-terminal cleavage/methylation domain-containing protein [Desulfobacteraceae bacterium]|nr:MAG: prepilin-type N-terminal cleavage/methylation domain-containing protein [Desulfobacteraceae bacterium]
MLKPFDKNNNEGFTLLEVMIAFSIIAIVITTIWGLHSKTVLLSLNTQFDTQAPFLAEEKMSQLSTKKIENDEMEEGDFGEYFQGYVWKSSVSNIESETLGTLAEKVKKMEVSIGFNEGEFSYSIISYRFMQE